jgi:hypothetical protein
MNRLKVRLQAFEDEVVSCHPNAPTHENDDVHEESLVQLSSKSLKNCKRISLNNVEM